MDQLYSSSNSICSPGWPLLSFVWKITWRSWIMYPFISQIHFCCPLYIWYWRVNQSESFENWEIVLGWITHDKFLSGVTLSQSLTHTRKSYQVRLHLTNLPSQRSLPRLWLGSAWQPASENFCRLSANRANDQITHRIICTRVQYFNAPSLLFRKI